MNVVAVIPVSGRLPLVRLTIKRLIEKNGCENIICMVDTEQEAEVCRSANAHAFLTPEGAALGKKWNLGFWSARSFSPDSVLFVGSSDWVSDDWIFEMAPYLDDHGMVGSPGCYFGDFQRSGTRLVYWPGYENGMRNTRRGAERAGEPIGIGRMISAECLDAIRWQPFDDDQQNSLDWRMYQKVLAAGFSVGNILPPKIYALSISCDKWGNKHRFEDHWSNRLPSEKVDDPVLFLDRYFPEHKEFTATIHGN